jgi:hypothetical protein
MGLMKLLGVIVLGVLASLTLTILGELIVSTMHTSGWHVYVWILGPEFPLIALLVGTLVVFVIINRAAALHSQRLVDVLPLGVAGDLSATGVRRFHQVVTVIDENARRSRRLLVNAPSEPVALEADRLLRANHFPANQAVTSIAIMDIRPAITAYMNCHAHFQTRNSSGSVGH